MPPCLLPGFSFAEVMFAVIILGIGFIMIASIFPVAIQQGKATNDETTAAAAAKAQVAMLSDVISDGGTTTASDVPALGPNLGGLPSGLLVYGQVYSLRDPQPDTSAAYPWLNLNMPVRAGWSDDQTWDKCKGNLISPTDPRFASVVLFRRDRTADGTPAGKKSPYIQLYVITAQVRNRSIYDATTTGVDVASTTTGTPTPPVNLQARPVKVAISAKTNAGNISKNPNGTDLIAFEYDPASTDQQLLNAAGADEGCFVIIARDHITGPPGPVIINGTTYPGINVDKGRMNGRIYRVGTRRTELENNTTIFPSMNKSIVFDLAPGGDFTPDPGYDGALGGANKADDIYAIGIDGNKTGEGSSVTFNGRADAFIVGRNLQPRALATDPPVFEGPAQDISIYTTFIQPK